MEQKKTIFYNYLILLIFISGILLRSYLFFINNYFNDDECRLALTMFNKNIFDMFLPLGIAQSAPPVFMVLSKISSYISNYNEHVLKFIPYLSGIISLFVFYKIIKKYFNNKISTILGMFLFCVNYHLVVFSSVFKQYSVDVLAGLICFYCFYNIYNSVELSKKQLLTTAFLIIIMPFCSLISVFFIIPFIIFYIIKNIKNKDICIKLSGILLISGILMFLYYFFNLEPSSIEMKKYYGNMWNEGFWNNISGFINLFVLNIKYYIHPNKFILLPFILVCSGIISIFFDKHKNKDMTVYIIAVFLTVGLISYLNLYPFLGRVTLFLTPFIIMLCLKPFDLLSEKNNILLVFISIFIFGGFFEYLKPSYYKDLFYINYSPNKLMKILKNKYNSTTDIVLFNSASDSSFVFYTYKNNFYPEKKSEIPYKPIIKDAIENYLNTLDYNKGYWFYLIKEYSSEVERGYILDWLEQQETNYYIKDKDSYLYYISPKKIKRIKYE